MPEKPVYLHIKLYYNYIIFTYNSLQYYFTDLQNI